MVRSSSRYTGVPCVLILVYGFQVNLLNAPTSCWLITRILCDPERGVQE